MNLPNPFSKYFALEGSATFTPEIKFESTEFSLTAVTKRGEQAIYGLSDVLDYKGRTAGSRSNFQGLIGERILSVVLDELVKSTLEELSRLYPSEESSGKVLKETAGHYGKGFAVSFNNDYLLRYSGKTNFVILRKAPYACPSSWYEQEKLGMQASEIDGLAYLHFGSQKYLLVGESKTVSDWDNFENNDFARHVTEETLLPLQSLFPEHQQIYVLLGRQVVLFNSNGRPRRKLSKLAEQLGGSILIVPFPATTEPIEEYAQRMSQMLPLAKKILESLGKA